MQEEQDLGGVGVAFCEREEVEVVVADVEVLVCTQSFSIGPRGSRGLNGGL